MVPLSISMALLRGSGRTSASGTWAGGGCMSVTCGYFVFGVGTAPDLKWPWRHTGNAEKSQRQDEGPVGQTPGKG